jgi:YYY domain-containing protein
MMDEPLRAPARSRLWPRWKLVAGIALVAVAAPLLVNRIGSAKLMLPPGALADQRSHGTWREMFDLHGIATAIPLPLWIVALVGAGLVGFPYAWLVARSLPDRGSGLARVVGLLLVTWLVWWLASLRLVPFGRVAIWLSVAIVAAGAIAIFARRRHEILSWVRADWRLVLTVEAVFWVLFALFLFVRWSNPDLWHPSRGGEKPMDFAYLNAVIKSTSFPPFDPWFAGGQMNYYYYGFVQVAALAKLTGIPPAIAYNLAIPTLAGLLGAASFSAAFGLASYARRSAVPVALLAAGFVVLLGNLGELRVIRSWLNHEQIPVEWWFWNPTRVIHPGEGEPGPITEMPAFTYIFGDLHAHAMALPLAALAVALVVAVVRHAGRPGLPWLTMGLLGVVLGALWVTNTWDLPTYTLVALCGLALAVFAGGVSRRGLFLLAAGAALVVAVAYVAFLPFHLHYEAVFDGVQRWEGRRSRFVDYLTVNGFFLFVIVSGLVVQFAFARDLSSVARAYRLGLGRRARLDRFRELHGSLVHGGRLYVLGLRTVPVAPAFAVVCAAFGHGAAAAAVAIAAIAVLAWPARRRRGTSVREQALRRLAIVFVVLGLALTIAVEYYVLRNIDIGRTNTVFKVYLQVWVLWALAAAVSVGVIYERLPRVNVWVREPWRVAFVLLFFSAALYPILAARAKIDDRFDTSVGRTLDGTAYMRTAEFYDQKTTIATNDDRDAIRWVEEHVDGSPVFAEVNTAPTLYGWQQRYAVYTGNPTVVGWDWHQRQQRTVQSEQVWDRVHAIQRLYGTADPEQAYKILRRYGASYAVLGPLERAYYPKGTAKWVEGEGRFWTVAYRNPGVTIYRVSAAG